MYPPDALAGGFLCYGSDTRTISVQQTPHADTLYSEATYLASKEGGLVTKKTLLALLNTMCFTKFSKNAFVQIIHIFTVKFPVMI